MGYKPWPLDGCSLAEARSRMIDAHSVRRDDRSAVQCAADVFYRALASGKFIAYGYGTVGVSDRCLIPANLWPTAKVLLAMSGVYNKDLGLAFTDVRVSPLLLSSESASQIHGKTLAEAFKQYVVEDPEVWALSRGAISKAPEYGAVYHHARCHPLGEEVWPIAVGGWLAGIGTPESRISPIGCLLVDDEPQQVIDAADALRIRFDALFDMLRQGELVGRGITASDGIEREIPRSVWSHLDFFADLAAGDIVQQNHESTGKSDAYIRRWIGVMFTKPSVVAAQPSLLSTGNQNSAPKGTAKTRTLIGSQSKAGAVYECEKWLTSEMRKSPHCRVGKKDDWWDEAKQRLGMRLSRRGFDRAWDSAVELSNARAWSQAGAPTKTKQ